MSEAVCRYARSNAVIESEEQGSPVLLHLQSWDFIEFDKIGGSIWALLETPKTLAELTDVLVERFEVNRQTCESDVGAFLEKLVEAGLATICDDGGN